MAFEGIQQAVPGLEAAGDLSSNQHYPVAMTTTAKRVNTISTDGAKVFGVLQNKPDAAGKAATVVGLGVTKVVAGEALAAGDFWGVDATGRAKKVEATNTGADTGDYVAGQVIEAASAAGEKATVTIGFPTFVVESV